VSVAAIDNAGAARSASLGAWLKRRAAPLIVFALLFLLWEGAVHLTGIKEYLLPPPSKVWTEFLKRYPTVMDGAWVTTQEIIAGYLLAVVVSIPLALTSPTPRRRAARDARRRDAPPAIRGSSVAR